MQVKYQDRAVLYVLALTQGWPGNWNDEPSVLTSITDIGFCPKLRFPCFGQLLEGISANGFTMDYPTEPQLIKNRSQ